jgi:hypothetical protein
VDTTQGEKFLTLHQLTPLLQETKQELTKSIANKDSLK